MAIHGVVTRIKCDHIQKYLDQYLAQIKGKINFVFYH